MAISTSSGSSPKTRSAVEGMVDAHFCPVLMTERDIVVGYVTVWVVGREAHYTDGKIYPKHNKEDSYNLRPTAKLSRWVARLARRNPRLASKTTFKTGHCSKTRPNTSTIPVISIDNR